MRSASVGVMQCGYRQKCRRYFDIFSGTYPVLPARCRLASARSMAATAHIAAHTLGVLMGVKHEQSLPRKEAVGIGADGLARSKGYFVVDVGADAGVRLGHAVPRLTSADDENRGGDEPDPVVAVLETTST